MISPSKIQIFQLIDKVGSSGPYQRYIFIIFAFQWFITGIFMLGTTFMLTNESFNCQKNGLLIKNCQTSICSIEQTQRNKYIQLPIYQSLAVQFGPFSCQEQSLLTLAKSSTYFGALFGYVFFMLLTDNLGRKASMVFCWTVACIGIQLLCISQNIWMAIAGLFLAGAGSQSSIKVTMVIFSEIVEYNLRQRYSVSIELFFAGGGVMVGVIYYFLYNWRNFLIIFGGIPSIIILIFLIFYLEETPKFLLKKKKQNLYKSLNRIGLINKGQKQCVTYNDIQRYEEFFIQNQNQKKQQIITWYHLIHYPSLRSITIPICLLFFFINYLYFGPLFSIQSLGLDIRLSQIVLSGSELVSYIFSYFTVEKLPRKLSGIIMVGISSLISTILIFVPIPQSCNQCFESVINIILMFCVRFLICYYYSIMFVYIIQLYPMRARGIGFGSASAFGAIGASSANYVLSIFSSYKISYMILFSVTGFLSVSMLLFLKQTFKKPLSDQIQQIKQNKKENINLVQQVMEKYNQNTDQQIKFKQISKGIQQS